MCVVLQHSLARGPVLRCAAAPGTPPLHPPGPGRTKERMAAPGRALRAAPAVRLHSRGIEPRVRHRNVSPFQHSQSSGRCITVQGRCQAPPKPPWPGGVPAPWTPDHFMETGEGSFRAALPRTHPIDQPSAGWMRAISSKMDHDRGHFPLPGPHGAKAEISAIPLASPGGRSAARAVRRTNRRPTENRATFRWFLARKHESRHFSGVNKHCVSDSSATTGLAHCPPVHAYRRARSRFRPA